MDLGVPARNPHALAMRLVREGELRLTETHITLRTAYRQALTEGTTVLGLKDAKAIEESERLVDEVLTILGLPARKPNTSPANV